MDGSKLSDEEAAAMLARLARHFGEPVMPIRRYCDGLRTWQRALEQRADRLRLELYPGIEGSPEDPATEAAFAAYTTEMRKPPDRPAAQEATERDRSIRLLRIYQKESTAIGHVFLQIGKSCLLDRLLYGGEPLRSVPCPEHKGTWSGIEGFTDRCAHGCGLTGWLPEDAGARVGS